MAQQEMPDVAPILGFVPAWDPVPKHQQAKWPPDGHRGDHDVSFGNQNWYHVATINFIDAKDLIYFNFRTLNYRKVNWYLHHYVGCWSSTDGKNFDFEGAMPGKIFIPPIGWTRRSSQTPLNLRVYSELENAWMYFPNVQYRRYGYSVTRREFKEVADLIRDGDIEVEENSKALATTGALARATSNQSDKDHPTRWLKLILRDGWAASPHDRMLLVHEAVHLILHRHARQYTHFEHEFLARLTTETYLHNCGKENLSIGSTYMRRLGRYLSQMSGDPKSVDAFDKIMAHDTGSWSPGELTGTEMYNVVQKAYDYCMKHFSKPH